MPPRVPTMSYRTSKPASQGSIVKVTLLYGELDVAVDLAGSSLQVPNHGAGACPAENAGKRKMATAAAAARIRGLTADNIASRASPVKGMDFGAGTYYHSAQIVWPLSGL